MDNSGSLIIRFVGKILVSTALVSLVVLLIGYLLRWSGPFHFSNGFFTAGAILVILGILFVTGGFTQRSNFGIMYSESAGQRNTGGRTQHLIADMTQRYGNFILLLVTGLLLIGISAAIGSFL